MAVRGTPSHVLHAVLSVGTAGLWLPIWIGTTLARLGRFHCPRCGTATAATLPGLQPARRRPLATLRDMALWPPMVRWWT